MAAQTNRKQKNMERGLNLFAFPTRNGTPKKYFMGDLAHFITYSASEKVDLYIN